MQIGSHFKPFHGSLSHLEEKIQPPTMTQKALCHLAPVDLSRLCSGPFLSLPGLGRAAPSISTPALPKAHFTPHFIRVPACTSLPHRSLP